MRTLLVLLLTAAALFAGSYGWNTDPVDDPRILEAFGSILGKFTPGQSPVPATQREVSAAAMNWVNQQTADYERRKNMQAFTPPPFQSTPMAAAATRSDAPEPTATPKKKK